MRKLSKPILTAAALVLIGGALWLVWAKRPGNPAALLSETYQKMADCRQEGKTVYPMNWSDDLRVPPEGMQNYRECMENSKTHAEFQGLDLKVIDVEVLCRCKNIFAGKLLKEIQSGSLSECRSFQAVDSIEEQCRDIAKKAGDKSRTSRPGS